jgi:hypothetical protein
MLDLLVQLNNSEPLRWPLEVQEFDQNSRTSKRQCTGDGLTTESWRNQSASVLRLRRTRAGVDSEVKSQWKMGLAKIVESRSIE